MKKDQEIEQLVKNIQSLLHKLESTFWDVYAYPSESDAEFSRYWEIEKQDKETWLYEGTKSLYLKICYFIELKEAPDYLNQFRKKFETTITNQEKAMKVYGGLYNDSEPAVIIHDEFREFLSAFPDFDYDLQKKNETNKLRLILDNTNSILSQTNTKVTNETSIYSKIKWLIEIIYPKVTNLGKARFIKKFKTYNPDILVPEISSAVEYKFIRKGLNIQDYIDQLKTDADNYEGDPEFKFFYAVVYFEDKTVINQAAFEAAVEAKKFPDNWEIIFL